MLARGPDAGRGTLLCRRMRHLLHRAAPRAGRVRQPDRGPYITSDTPVRRARTPKELPPPAPRSGSGRSSAPRRPPGGVRRSDVPPGRAPERDPRGGEGAPGGAGSGPPRAPSRPARVGRAAAAGLPLARGAEDLETRSRRSASSSAPSSPGHTPWSWVGNCRPPRRRARTRFPGRPRSRPERAPAPRRR